MKKKAIFLDRDGTLIVDKNYLNSIEGIEYLPGVFEGLRLLRDAGYVFVVVTNQSGVARGNVDIQNLQAIHRALTSDCAREGVDITRFYYAPYLPESNHPNRKPNPGMLLTGARDHDIDLSTSWMIGDRISDVEAGRRAGTRTVLLRNTQRKWPENKEAAEPTYRTDAFFKAAEFILANS